MEQPTKQPTVDTFFFLIVTIYHFYFRYFFLKKLGRMMIFVQTYEHRQDINRDVIVSLAVSRLVTWQQMPLLLVVQCVNYQTNCRV